MAKDKNGAYIFYFTKIISMNYLLYWLEYFENATKTILIHMSVFFVGKLPFLHTR